MRHLKISRLLLAGGCAMAAFLCAASLAVAAEPGQGSAYSSDFLTRPALTGDWGGARTRWEEGGVTLKPRLSKFNKEGVGLFGQFEISDGNPNYLHWMAFGGLGGTGMIPGRSRDNWGIGYYYFAPADGLHDLPPPNPQIRDEQGFEAFYNFTLTPWFILGADLQVIDAGLATDWAVLPGVRTVIRF